MQPSEALTLLAVLQSNWPRGGWLEGEGELTPRGQLYAATLANFDAADGTTAVTVLLRMTYRDFSGPQNGDLYRELVAARRDRLIARPALPPQATLDEAEREAQRSEVAKIFAGHRARMASKGTGVDELVRRAMPEPRIGEPPGQIEERRRRKLAEFDERYGPELEAERARREARERLHERIEDSGREAPGL